MTWALLIPIKIIKNAHFQRASEAVVSMLGTRLFSETQAKTSLLPKSNLLTCTAWSFDKLCSETAFPQSDEPIYLDRGHFPSFLM